VQTNPRQEPAFCVQVEFTEGCNLQCSFCGLQGIREKAGGPYKFMTSRVAERAALQLQIHRWNSRIEFAMHGEPTMNPWWPELVRVFRRYLPRNQLMMTSNGTGFLKDTRAAIVKAFRSGLNVLALDDYKTVNIVPKVLERAMVDDLWQEGITAVRYPQDGLQYSPHRRWPHSARMLIIIEDIADATSGSHADINNHAGFGSTKTTRRINQRCAKPFRELGVRWDGRVAGCCIDWTGSYKIGNLMNTDLDVLWQHPRFQAMRRKLYAGQRDFGPCAGCDHGTYRLGLLPDKLGKQTLPAPNGDDIEIIRDALGGKSYTPLVWRPWMGGKHPSVKI
jgi:hypothetical protein